MRNLTHCKGAWTLIRNEGLCNDSLAERGFANSLHACVTRNSGTISVSKKMMATAMEAILGAVHLDGGDDALTRVMEHLRIVQPLHTMVMLKNPFDDMSSADLL